MILAIVTFAIVLLVCVGFHEFGHFTAAKLCGIRVDEFAIGFGPRIVSWGRGETRYSLRALPLGGFVRMAGMLGLPGEGDAGKRNFYRASISRRLIVMLAGVLFNLVLGLVLATVSGMIPISGSVLAGSPAAHAGLTSSDSLVRIGNVTLATSTAQARAQSTTTALAESQGMPTQVTYRDSSGTVHDTTITPALGFNYANVDNPNCSATRLPQGGGFINAINGHEVGTGDATTLVKAGDVVDGSSDGQGLGGSCAAANFRATITSSALKSLSLTWRFGVVLDTPGASLGESLGDATSFVVTFIPDVVTDIRGVVNTPGSGGAFGPNGLQGPVGIASEAGTSAQGGLGEVLLFMAVISVNLGYLNLIPIPFLDGGKIFIVLVEAVRGRRLAPEREAAIYAVGLAIIVVLAVLVTIANLRSTP